MKKHTLPLIVAGLLLALGAGAAQAQTMYRSVGPDGRVTFSDTPPPTGTGKAAPAGASAAAVPSDLPYALRQVASRYPVTLYTGNGCGPCGAGRAYLSGRGIPFTERTVTSAEDIEALQRLSGDTGLPFLTIGSQQIKGFSDTEWSEFLDAANYPKTSQLPPSYRAPAATPLVAVERAAPAARNAARANPAGESGADAANAPPRPEPRNVNENPAGIRF